MSHRTASMTDPLAWLRDAVQARLLAQLFTGHVHDIVLKGGMAMRVSHGMLRATQDIDLDASAELPLATLQNVVRRAVLSATRTLMTDVVVTEPKQTETTARWKIAGRDPATNMVLHLTVEISRRDQIDAADVRTVASSLPGTIGAPIQVYSDQALAFKKVKALLADNRSALRDVVDLFLLIRADVEPPILHLRRWLRTTPPETIQEVWAKLESMDENRFRTEVLPALPADRSSLAWLEDWDAIRLSVGQTVHSWLEKAKAPDTMLPVEPSSHRMCLT